MQNAVCSMQMSNAPQFTPGFWWRVLHSTKPSLEACLSSATNYFETNRDLDALIGMDERTELRVALNLAISALHKVASGQKMDLDMLLRELEEIRGAAEQRSEFQQRLHCILQLSLKTQHNQHPKTSISAIGTGIFSLPKQSFDSTKCQDNATVWPAMELL